MFSKKQREIVGFDDRKFMLLGIPIAGLTVNFLMFSNVAIEDPQRFFTIHWGISIVYTAIYWFVFRSVVVFVRKRYRDIYAIKQRIFYQIILIVIAFTLLESFFVYTLHPWVKALCGIQELPSLAKYFSIFILSFAILGVYEVIFNYTKTRELMIENEKLHQEQLRSQLHGLRNQVKPHFLFNSLNTLTSLIPLDTDRAVRFVEKLSKVYRYLLDIHDQKMITLQAELDYVDAYLHLMKERFQHSLQISIAVEEKYLEKFIAPLSIQLLVENAIKHNVVAKDQPLKINIGISNEGYLFVKNNLQLKDQLIESTKTGLENIKKRYEFLSDKPVEVIRESQFFQVSIPLITLSSKLST